MTVGNDQHQNTAACYAATIKRDGVVATEKCPNKKSKATDVAVLTEPPGA